MALTREFGDLVLVLVLVWRSVLVVYFARAVNVIRVAFAVSAQYEIPKWTLDFWLMLFLKAFVGIPVAWTVQDVKHFELVATSEKKSRLVENTLDQVHLEVRNGHPMFVAEDNNEAGFQDRKMMIIWMSVQLKKKYNTEVIPIIDESVRRWGDADALKLDIIKLIVKSFQAVAFDTQRPLPWKRLAQYLHVQMYKRFDGPFGWLPAALPWIHKLSPLAAALKDDEEYVNKQVSEELKQQKQMHAGGQNVLYTYWLQNTRRDLSNSDYEFEKFVFQTFSPNLATSSFNIFFMMYFMTQFQDFQEQAFNEVYKATNGDPAKLTLTVLQELKLIGSFINEVLRFLGPIRVQSRLVKGIDIAVNIGNIHRDEKYFENPNTFVPHRFVDEKQRHNPAFRPFGYGPRMCPAQGYVNVIYRTTLAIILLNHRIQHSRHITLKQLKYTQTPIAYWAGGDEWLQLGKYLTLSKRTCVHSRPEIV